MIKTGILSEAYFGVTDYREGLQKIKAHGYDCLDYSGLMSPESKLYELSTAEFENYFKEFGKCVKDTGLEIFQMHGLWPTYELTSEGRERSVTFYKKEIGAAAIMHCKHIVIHPCMPYGWGEEPSVEEVFEENVRMFEKILPTAKEANVIVCVENMPFAKGHSFSNIHDIKRLVCTIDDPYFKVCFDSGHCNVTGEDAYEALTVLDKDLAVLHVHDDANRQDRHLIPFQGQVNWDGYIKALNEIGYNGCISLETSISQKMPEPIKEQFQIALANLARYFASQIEG